MVDKEIHFSTVTFSDSYGSIYGQSVDGIWKALVEISCTIYPRFPKRLRTGQGSVLNSDHWKQLIHISAIEFRLSGAHAHTYLEIGERLHRPLRQIFRKTRHDYPDVSQRLILKPSVKETDDTINENGLAPSRLIFGMIYRFAIRSTDIPAKKECKLSVLLRRK